MEELMIAESTGLRPARVESVAGDGAILEGGARARIARSCTCRPEPGDLVLAAGEEEAWIVAVLEGRGRTVLEAHGDLELRAGGRIELTAREISLQADRVETVARAAFEKFVRAYRWVRDAFQIRAGRVRVLADEQYSVQAGRIVENAEQEVRIDGERIHLG